MRDGEVEIYFGSVTRDLFSHRSIKVTLGYLSVKVLMKTEVENDFRVRDETQNVKREEEVGPRMSSHLYKRIKTGSVLCELFVYRYLKTNIVLQTSVNPLLITVFFCV